MEIGLEKFYRELMDSGIGDVEDGKYGKGIAKCLGFALLPGIFPVFVDNVGKQFGLEEKTSMSDCVFGLFMQAFPVDMILKCGVVYSASDYVAKYIF